MSETILITDWSLKCKMSLTFTDSSFSIAKICCFAWSCLIVNTVFLSFVLLIGQTQQTTWQIPTLRLDWKSNWTYKGMMCLVTVRKTPVRGMRGGNKSGEKELISYERHWLGPVKLMWHRCGGITRLWRRKTDKEGKWTVNHHTQGENLQNKTGNNWTKNQIRKCWKIIQSQFLYQSSMWNSFHIFFFLLYISSSFPLFFSAQSDLRPSSSRDASATLLLSNCFHGYKVAPCLTPTLPPPEVASVRVLLCVHFLQPGDDVSVLRRV